MKPLATFLVWLLLTAALAAVGNVEHYAERHRGGRHSGGVIYAHQPGIAVGKAIGDFAILSVLLAAVSSPNDNRCAIAPKGEGFGAGREAQGGTEGASLWWRAQP